MRIRAKRKELGLKQGQLAKLAGISQPALCELEKGDTKMPNAESLMGLAKALNVTQAWIITGKDGEIEQISQDEESMVRAIRTLTAEQQRAIYQIIDSMKKTE